MPAKVTLRIASGEMAGQEFVFDQRDCCFAGRGTNCSVRIPSRVDKLISGQHCMLDINPPETACRGLINAANDAGGTDNVTVVVVDV